MHIKTSVIVDNEAREIIMPLLKSDDMTFSVFVRKAMRDYINSKQGRQDHIVTIEGLR